MMMVVFTIFFGRMAGSPSGDLPYPLFAYAGPAALDLLRHGHRQRRQQRGRLGAADHQDLLPAPGDPVRRGRRRPWSISSIAFGLLVALMMLYYGASPGGDRAAGAADLRA